MEEQILRFYLKIFSFLFFLFLFIYLFFVIFINKIEFKNEYLIINKNQNYNNLLDENLIDKKINLFIYKLLLKSILLTNENVYFGKFDVKDTKNFISFIKIITNYSNYNEKITIIEGSIKKDLNRILIRHFNDFSELKYTDVIADTYYFRYGSSFEKFKKSLEKNISKLREKFKKNELSKRFSFKEIIIIGSLIEKEAINNMDKKLIFSVILNRLNINMKLQIDATVIYAITDGGYTLDRKLTYKDLKVKHNFNTYFIRGLPPAPISYVGLETIEIILENFHTNYLFYFYNSLQQKHIFSINYKNHLNKLNEYRSKK